LPASTGLRLYCVSRVFPVENPYPHSLCPPEDSQFKLTGIPVSLRQDDFEKWSAEVLQ
jgi:hypothetical protein